MDGEPGAVSIHAPTRGATHGGPELPDLGAVSIHAPTRGATHGLLPGLRGASRFNPRAHAGRDGRSLQCVIALFTVSIHAPTRGATMVSAASAAPTKFQSTRPRGARPRSRLVFRSCARFQSTRPRGARQRKTLTSGVTTPFQSTRPRGARLHLNNNLKTMKKIPRSCEPWKKLLNDSPANEGR